MVLEIAVGVCLGLIVAVVLLKYWKVLLVGSLAITVWAVAIAAVVAIAVVAWKNIGGKILVLIGAMVALTIVGILANFVHREIIKRFPSLDTIIKGKAPWNTPARMPIRVLAVGGFVLAVAGICVGVILGAGYLIDAGSK